MHDLLFAATNGEHIESMSHIELREYIKSIGLIIQKLPSELRVNGEPSILTLLKINEFDPSSYSGNWGNICLNIAKTLDISLPEKGSSNLT